MQEYDFSSPPKRISAHEFSRSLRRQRASSKRRKIIIRIFAIITFSVIAVALSPLQLMQGEPIEIGINSENWMPILVCLFALVITILMERAEDDFMYTITKILSSYCNER